MASHFLSTLSTLAMSFSQPTLHFQLIASSCIKKTKKKTQKITQNKEKSFVPMLKLLAACKERNKERERER